MNKKALIAEFIGTFCFVFIGIGSIVADYWSSGKLGMTGIALAHGLAIGVMASATAAISGGHLNPAVTISLWSAKKIDTLNAIGYIVVQFLGAICAALLIKLAVPTDALNFVSLGIPALGYGITPMMGLITEAVLTFILVFVIYGTAVDARAPKVGGLFIGLAITLDILMGGPISGAAMNPARYIGPAVASLNFQHAWIYFVGPIVGGVLAAQIYKLVLEK